MRPRKSTVLVACLSIAALTAAASGGLQAREKLTYDEGLSRCTAWCGSHNIKGGSKFWQCYDRCNRYWRKNGSDRAGK